MKTGSARPRPCASFLVLFEPGAHASRETMPLHIAASTSLNARMKTWIAIQLEAYYAIVLALPAFCFRELDTALREIDLLTMPLGASAKLALACEPLRLLLRKSEV